jgi:hypothetical protein
VVFPGIFGRNVITYCSGVYYNSDFVALELYRQNHVAGVLRFYHNINLRLSFRFFY